MTIIKKILKQLTPERIKKEIEEIQKLELPPEIQKWVREYERVGVRDEFFWKFMYKANQIIDPFNVPNIYKKSIIEIKFLIIIFTILLDDIADKERNKKLLNELIKIPFKRNHIEFGKLNKEEKEYLKFSIKLWCYIEKEIKKYPRYKEFRNIFSFDFSQVLNAIEYSFFINQTPSLINKTEYWNYSSHTLQGLTYCSLDLMCFPKFAIKELGIVREIFWQAQRIARIGNCLSTWKRELKEGDLTSGILAYAIGSDSFDINDLNKKNKIKLISKINYLNIRYKLLKKWQQYYDEIRYLCRKIKSIKTRRFLLQLEKLTLIYLIGEKYI